MDLLRTSLPSLSIRPGVPPGHFLDQCENVATSRGYRVYRGRDYAGPGFDHLNVYLGKADPWYPMLRMVSTPRLKSHLNADVVAMWKSYPLHYDEYVKVAKFAYARLLTLYAAKYGRRPRLGVPRRPVFFNFAEVQCGSLDYAQGKFREAVRSLAVGPGDARDRMLSAFLIIHVVRPEELPPPLSAHLGWVYRQLTRRAPRYKGEGTVAATLAQMRNSTAGRIAERILALSDALDEIVQQKKIGTDTFS